MAWLAAALVLLFVSWLSWRWVQLEQSDGRWRMVKPRRRRKWRRKHHH